jgi:hypothetical protein
MSCISSYSTPTTTNIKSDTLTMAKPGKCEHSFKVIKSDTTLILWNCNMCHSGPHWWIYECAKCKLKACKTCMAKAYVDPKIPTQ